jgi:hypothetical protein
MEMSMGVYGHGKTVRWVHFSPHLLTDYTRKDREERRTDLIHNASTFGMKEDHPADSLVFLFLRAGFRMPSLFSTHVLHL